MIRWTRPPFGVEFHHDPKNKFKFAQDEQDDVWISKVAGKGWIILSHDRKFHTRLPEIAAIKQYEAGCFYLPHSNSPTWDKVCHFTRVYTGIVRRVSLTARPFIYEVTYAATFRPVQIPKD